MAGLRIDGCPVFVVTGDSETEWEAAATATRKQIAFYGSTPAYRKVLKLAWLGRLAQRAVPALAAR